MRKRAEPLDGVPKSRCCTRETGEGEGDSFVILRDRRFERKMDPGMSRTGGYTAGWQLLSLLGLSSMGSLAEDCSRRGEE